MARALGEVFAGRPNRFRLLDAGAERADWPAGARLLEIGCGGGEAAAHMAERFGARVTGIDADREAIDSAAAHPLCTLLAGDAERLPFPDGSFDGAYCEAAFSVIQHKAAAAGELFRALKPGGRVLLNDFALAAGRNHSREGLEGIPCLKGAQAAGRYKEMFAAAGFNCIYYAPCPWEYVGIIAHLSKSYGVTPARLGGYLTETFCGGGDGVKLVPMTYCQMIFQKGV